MNITEFAIKRPAFISSLMIVILTVGYISFKKMNVELFPKIDIPTIFISTRYDGAAPSEIESLVSKPLEEEISTVSGIKKLFSRSMKDTSQVIVQLYSSVDIKYAEQQIRDKINQARDKLPEDIKEPVIRRVDPADQPIITVILKADLPENEMFDLADNFVRPRLEQAADVGMVEILGARKREIQVLLDQNKLKSRQISLSEINRQLANSGQNVSVGTKNFGEQERVFRSASEFNDLKQIENNLVSFYFNETPTKISDVGVVIDTLEDESSRAFIDGQKSLFLTVYRQSDANIIKVVDGIKAQIAKMEKDFASMNGKPSIATIKDASTYIRGNIDDILETITIAIILTVITVLFFLGSGRATLITAISLPISLVGSFIIMYAADFSINVITMLALSLAVGLLVDDAIVVVENIYRKIEEGMNPIEAAIKSSREILMAVVAITAVVVSVFTPISFLKGIVGQYLKQFGLTISFSMMISLLVAISIVPVLCAYLSGHRKKKTNEVQIHQKVNLNEKNEEVEAVNLEDRIQNQESLGKFDISELESIATKNENLAKNQDFAPKIQPYSHSKNHGLDQILSIKASATKVVVSKSFYTRFNDLQHELENQYEKVLKFSIARPGIVLLSTLVIMFFSISAFKKVPKTFMSESDNGEITTSIELPADSNLENTSKTALQIDEIIHQFSEVKITAVSVGTMSRQSNRGEIYIKLKPKKERAISTTEFKEELRKKLVDFKFANPVVKDFDPSGGASRGQPFNLFLTSANKEVLEAYAAKLFEKFSKDPRLKDLDTSNKATRPEFKVRFKENASKIYGINTQLVGNELRGYVEGYTPTKLRQNGLEYNIRIRLKDEQRDLQENFNNIFVSNLNNKMIRLSDIATSEEGIEPATINRQDRGRYIQITASLASKVGLGDLMSEVQKDFVEGEFKLPSEIRYSFSGDSENMQDMVSSMNAALLLSIIFIYLILTALYESFITPFTILLALPLAFCGAFYALFVMGESVNIFTMLGIFILVGVAGKNSILLIDFANRLLEEGKSRSEAIIISGRQRLRPILMTSLALIVGTLPVAIGMSETSSMRTSMGVAIIGGLISSTLLTLVVVPAVFSYIDRFRVWIKAKLWKLVG